MSGVLLKYGSKKMFPTIISVLRRFLILIILLITGLNSLIWLIFILFIFYYNFILQFNLIAFFSVEAFSVFFLYSSIYSFRFLLRVVKNKPIKLGLNTVIGIFLYLAVALIFFTFLYYSISPTPNLIFLVFLIFSPTAFNDHPFYRHIVDAARKNQRVLFGIPAIVIYSSFPLTFAITLGLSSDSSLYTFIESNSLLPLYANFVAILIASYTILTFVFAEILRSSKLISINEQIGIEKVYPIQNKLGLIKEFNKILPLTIYFAILLIILSIIADLIPYSDPFHSLVLMCQFTLLQELIFIW